MNENDGKTIKIRAMSTYGIRKELPTDYEACGTCGFDHEYEPEEARIAHPFDAAQLPETD